MWGKLSCIDMGIALCHIAEEGDSFYFVKENYVPAVKKCVYMGTVIASE
jgi:hypothetical protein